MVAILVDQADKNRLRELIIDGGNRKFLLTYHSMITGTETRNIPFDDAFIEIPKTARKKKMNRLSVLHMYSGSHRRFEISMRKDRISETDILEILKTVRFCAIPVNE